MGGEKKLKIAYLDENKEQAVLPLTAAVVMVTSEVESVEY